MPVPSKGPRSLKAGTGTSPLASLAPLVPVPGLAPGRRGKSGTAIPFRLGEMGGCTAIFRWSLPRAERCKIIAALRNVLAAPARPQENCQSPHSQKLPQKAVGQAFRRFVPNRTPAIRPTGMSAPPLEIVSYACPLLRNRARSYSIASVKRAHRRVDRAAPHPLWRTRPC